MMKDEGRTGWNNLVGESEKMMRKVFKKAKQGFVGSDIYGVCEKAAMRSIERFLAGDDHCLGHLMTCTGL